MIPYDEEQERARVVSDMSVRQQKRQDQVDILVPFQEQLEVDLENNLQQTHVCTLIQTDLMFPDVDNQDLASGQGKQSALAFKVLILPSFSTVSALDIHDQDIVCHALRDPIGIGTLVPRHPDAFRSLLPFRFGHDAKFGAEEMIEKGGFPGRLGSEDGDEMVVEASWADLLEGKVIWERMTVTNHIREMSLIIRDGGSVT